MRKVETTWSLVDAAIRVTSLQTKSDDITFRTFPGFPLHLEMNAGPFRTPHNMVFHDLALLMWPSHFLFWWHWSWCPVNLLVPNFGFSHWSFLFRPLFGLPVACSFTSFNGTKVIPCMLHGLIPSALLYGPYSIHYYLKLAYYFQFPRECALSECLESISFVYVCISVARTQPNT